MTYKDMIAIQIVFLAINKYFDAGKFSIFYFLCKNQLCNIKVEQANRNSN